MRIAAAWRALWGGDNKASATASVIAMHHMGRAVATPAEYEKIAKEAYSRNAVAFKAIDEIARSGASVPLDVVRVRGGNAVPLDDHPLAALLRRPNPVSGRVAFFEALFAYDRLAGNAFIEAIGPDGRPPRELYPKRPDRMRVVAGDQGIPAAYEFRVGQAKVTFDVDPLTGKSAILHVRRFHPLDDWYGMSPIEAAAREVDQWNEAGVYNHSLLKNGARPSGAMVYKPNDGEAGTLSDDQFDRLKTQIDEQYRGSANAGRPMILEGGLDWREMSLSPKDVEWLEGRRATARDIAMAIGMPPQLLGIPGDNAYRNMEEARLSLWEQTVMPMIGLFLTELNHWLAPQFGDALEIRANYDGVPALAPRRWMLWDKVANAPWLTINERRAATNYEAVDGGDVVLIEATKIPLDFIGEAGGDEAAGDEGFANEGRGRDLKNTEYKLLTDRGDGARRREWRIQNRMRLAMERPAAASINGILAKAGHDAAEAVEQGKPWQDARGPLDERLNKALSAHWRGVMGVFGARIIDAVEKPDADPEPDGAVQATFEAAIEGWIHKHAEKRAGDIADTTMERIRAAAEAAEDETPEGVARAIREATGGDVARQRALAIARTETHGASVAAMDEAVRATGLDLTREWIAGADPNARASHKAADGQRRALDEPFDVGGTKVMHPGDPAAPTDETVQCCCVLGYVEHETEA